MGYSVLFIDDLQFFHKPVWYFHALAHFVHFVYYAVSLIAVWCLF